MKTLNISAGGVNSRIKSYCDINYGGIPKHILPLPNGGTIIEKIIKDSQSEIFDNIKISCNRTNQPFLKELLSNYKNIELEIDEVNTGPLTPLFSYLSNNNHVSYGCAGDFVCDFSWKDFIEFHKSHNLPISILVSKSTIVKNGAVFNLNKNKEIISWERKDLTLKNDLINIGCYIIEPSIKSEILSLPDGKEDTFFDNIIKLGKIAGFMQHDKSLGFNINTEETYESMYNYYKNTTP